MREKLLHIAVGMVTVAIILLGYVLVSSADITLTTPVTVLPQATNIKVVKITVTSSRVLAQMSYRSVDDQEVLSVECELTGADYNNVLNNSVTCPADDTKSFYTMFKKKVQNKCKGNMSIIGNEN